MGGGPLRPLLYGTRDAPSSHYTTGFSSLARVCDFPVARALSSEQVKAAVDLGAQAEEKHAVLLSTVPSSVLHLWEKGGGGA
jgi:hypothetical protein